MDAGCSCKLCQTADCIFHFSGSNHHQIGKLVHDDHDLWHFLHFFRPLFFRDRFDLLIIAFQITHALGSKLLVTFRHLRYCPVQSTGCLFRIGDNRDKQMRDPIVNTQFHDFWIDHDQLDIFRRSFVDQTHDDRIDAYRLTGSCCTGNQKMRHFCNIRHHNLSCQVLSNCN